jgi:hypothetical protein
MSPELKVIKQYLRVSQRLVESLACSKMQNRKTVQVSLVPNIMKQAKKKQKSHRGLFQSDRA